MFFPVSKIVSVAVLLIAVGSNVSAMKDMKCKGMDIKMTDVQMNNMKLCSTSVGVTSMEEMSMDKMACFGKCIMEKKGLMDEQGKSHKENIQKLIESTMPEPVRASLVEKAGKCLDEHGTKIDPKEATCMSYGPLTMCYQKAMTDECM